MQSMQRTVIIVSIRVLTMTTVQRGRMNSRSCQLHCGDTFWNLLHRPHKGRVRDRSIGFFISRLRKKQGPRHLCSTNCPCQPLEDYCKPRRGTEAQSIFINFPIGSRPSQIDWIMDDSSWCRIMCECCTCWFDLKLASSTSKYVRCLRLFLIYCSVS